MLFEIKRAKNGYIVQCDSEEHPTVFQKISDGTEEDEVEAFASFLWHMDDEYGPSTGKRSRKRIYVDIRPGHDCEEGWIRHTVILQLRFNFVANPKIDYGNSRRKRIRRLSE